MLACTKVLQRTLQALPAAACALMTVLAPLPSSAALAKAKRSYIRRPELSSGQWELRTPSGTYGLFITIQTWWRDPVAVLPCPGGGCACSHKVFVRELANPRRITHQRISIESYRPSRNTQWWGIGSSSLNGRRLRLNSLWGSLDAMFHPGAQEWTGIWTCQDQIQRVVLRRPRPSPATKPNPFVDNWLATPGPNMPVSRTSMYIVESSDGTVTAWLDRRSGGLDCRALSMEIYEGNGELQIFSANGGRISLQTTGPMGPPFRYEGRLSADDNEILGAWSSRDGEHFSAPGNFGRQLP